MLTANSSCYLTFFQNGGTRVLSPGKVLETYDNTATVQFPHNVDLKAGGKTTLFANWRGKFHSQNVSITKLNNDGGRSVINIETTGDPKPAGDDETFRISTLSQDIRLTIDKQINCQLADIGEEGLSVVTQQPLAQGSQVSINLTIDGLYAQGALTVIGQEKLPNGTTAFTLEVTDKKSNLRKSLDSLSATLQRKQLRKLTAAA